MLPHAKIIDRPSGLMDPKSFHTIQLHKISAQYLYPVHYTRAEGAMPSDYRQSIVSKFCFETHYCLGEMNDGAEKRHFQEQLHARYGNGIVASMKGLRPPCYFQLDVPLPPPNSLAQRAIDLFDSQNTNYYKYTAEVNQSAGGTLGAGFQTDTAFPLIQKKYAFAILQHYEAMRTSGALGEKELFYVAQIGGGSGNLECGIYKALQENALARELLSVIRFTNIEFSGELIGIQRVAHGRAGLVGLVDYAFGDMREASTWRKIAHPIQFIMFNEVLDDTPEHELCLSSAGIVHPVYKLRYINEKFLDKFCELMEDSKPRLNHLNREAKAYFQARGFSLEKLEGKIIIPPKLANQFEEFLLEGYEKHREEIRRRAFKQDELDNLFSGMKKHTNDVTGVIDYYDPTITIAMPRTHYRTTRVGDRPVRFTFPNLAGLLQNIYQKMAPGGGGIFADYGDITQAGRNIVPSTSRIVKVPYPGFELEDTRYMPTVEFDEDAPASFNIQPDNGIGCDTTLQWVDGISVMEVFAMGGFETSVGATSLLETGEEPLKYIEALRASNIFWKIQKPVV